MVAPCVCSIVLLRAGLNYEFQTQMSPGTTGQAHAMVCLVEQLSFLPRRMVGPADVVRVLFEELQ